MKNNTKIRLHLSKNLFESIAKEVLAESKKMNMSGGAYTEAVKMPKAKKSAEKMTDKMEKMEEMSSKEKMAKGMYKEVDAVGDTEKMRKMHEMSSKEKMAKGLYKEADMAKLKDAKAKIEKRLAEMEIDVAEEKKIEEGRVKKPTLNQLRKKK